MSLRRILVALLLVMIVTSIATSLSTDTDEPATAPAVRTPGGTGLVREVKATIPRTSVVRAASGDRVILAVVANELDQVQIEGYDLVEPVDPTTPARFDFIAEQEGSFAVTLVSTDKTLGRLEVVARP